MKMELLENGCLKIMLTEEDLDRLGLSSPAWIMMAPATRSALQTLLMAARNETGFDPAGGLVVEALPVGPRAACCCSPPLETIAASG